MKKFLKKILFRYKADSDSYINYLRQLGARVGERVRIYDPRNTLIDVTRPWLIEIGDDVQITSGVTILTHGYDWSVLKGKYGKVLGSAGVVSIGNNVFIGMNTTILKGVHIGNDVVIGANSLVNKDLESGYVYAGNPAKPIIKIEDYLVKREQKQLEEAEELYKYYKRQYQKEPTEEVFSEFFWLFTSISSKEETINSRFINKMKLVGNYEQSMCVLKNNKPMFDGYDEFLEYLKNKYGG